MQKIVPHLWFDQNIRDAADYYASAFPNTHVLEGFNHPESGEAITAEINIDGYRIALINGGPYATPNSSASFFLNFDPSQHGDAEGDLRHVWEKLTEDGEVLMDLEQQAFSKLYGWVVDRYGFNWQLMLSNPDTEPRPFVIPNLLFAGEVRGKATEAVDYYIEQIEGSALGNRVTYGSMGAAAGDKNSTDAIPQPSDVAFSDFQLAGQWFSAMDSGIAQPFTFNLAVSLMLMVKDQSELDRYWNELSAVAEQEQCGWLQDKYGVAWQVTPENISDLLARPHGYKNMMKMKKLIIDDF